MVSAQINGTYKIYIESPNGSRRLQKSAMAYWWGPGGSSEGVIANTPEKWNTLGLCPDVGGPGYKLIIMLVSGAAKTADASDGAMTLPIVVNSMPQIIGNSAHASGIGNDNFTIVQAAADSAYVAGSETPYLIYRANEGVYFQLGGDRVFLSIEDNA